jgi:hypothetical protein
METTLIDASTLFFPTTNHKNIAPAAATATAGIEDARLPRPFISFIASPSSDCGSRILPRLLHLVRTRRDQENEFTFIYDLRQQTVYHQRRLNEPKQFETVSVAVGEEGTCSQPWASAWAGYFDLSCRRNCCGTTRKLKPDHMSALSAVGLC